MSEPSVLVVNRFTRRDSRCDLSHVPAKTSIPRLPAAASFELCFLVQATILASWAFGEAVDPMDERQQWKCISSPLLTGSV